MFNFNLSVKIYRSIVIGKTMKKEKTTMIKEDELKQIYGGCIEEPSLKTGPLTMEDILDPFLNGFKIH